MTAQPKLPASAPLGSGAMFNAIAPRYDLLNRLISLGIDQSWRRKTVASLRLSPTDRALDLATGTADLAIMVARRTGASVVGLDPSTEMMKVGSAKIARLGLSEQISLVEGDAEELPFADGTFSAICMAFGIRNVPDRSRALREMVRVTCAGGRVAILELSEPRSGLMGAGARFHMRRVVPWLGGLLSRSREYRYLPASIQRFPSPEAFCALMSEAGLRDVQAESLTFGVCQLFTAEVP